MSHHHSGGTVPVLESLMSAIGWGVAAVPPIHGFYDWLDLGVRASGVVVGIAGLIFAYRRGRGAKVS
jgi:hypothetical protein